MEVKAYITRMDLLKMGIALIPRTRMVLYWFLFCLVCVAFSAREEYQEMGIIFWLAVTVLSALVLLFGCLVVSILSQIVFANEKNGFIGKSTFRVSSWGFEEENAGTETKTSWKNVDSICKTRAAIYIEISGNRLHVIPRRCFVNHDDFEHFAKIVENHKAKAQV